MRFPFFIFVFSLMLSCGLAGAQDQTITLSGGETQTNPTITGTNVTIAGSGTVQMTNVVTYTGTTTLSDGTATENVTLWLNRDTSGRMMSTSAIAIGSYATLRVSAPNAFFYVTSDAPAMNPGVITLKGNGTVNSDLGTNHFNIPKLSVSGTDNVLTSTGLGSEYGTYLLAGSIQVADGGSLEISTQYTSGNKITVRRSDASEKVGDVVQSGIFNVGTNGTVTVGSSGSTNAVNIRLENGASPNLHGRILKQGAGTLTIHNTIAGSGYVEGAAGVLNLNGNLSCDEGLKVTGGTVNVAGTISSAPISVTNGTLNYTGTHNGLGALNVSGGSATFSGTLTQMGGIKVSGGTFTFSGTPSGGVDSFGKLTVSGGKALIQSDFGTGLAGMDITGGTVEVTKENTFTRPITISNGGTLDLKTSFALKSSQITIQDGTLKMSASNAIGYLSDLRHVDDIHMAGNATLTNTTTGHSNLINVNVAGTGNVIDVIKNNGSYVPGSSYGNYLFGGKVTLADDSTLSINLNKLTVRGGTNGTSDVGKFDVGTNSLLTMNSNVILYDAANTTASTLTKQGAGTFFLNGTLTNSGNVVIENGTFAASGSQTFTGGTTITGGTLSIDSTAAGDIAALTLASGLTLSGGSVTFDADETGIDFLSVPTLVLDGGTLNLDWTGDDIQDRAMTYTFLEANSIVDGLGRAITNLTPYLSGDLGGHYNLVYENGRLTAYDATAFPEPASGLMLLLFGCWMFTFRTKARPSRK